MAFPGLQGYHPLCPDGLCKFQGLSIGLLCCFCPLRQEVQFQVFPFPYTAVIDVKVDAFVSFGGGTSKHCLEPYFVGKRKQRCAT